MNLGETSNTDSFAEVDVAGIGSSTNVVPVDGLRRELVGCGGLDGINPTCKNEALVFVALYTGMDPRVCEFTALKDLKDTLNRNIPGIGSFPCLFKKAAYASMNFCAWITTIESAKFRQRRSYDPLTPAQLSTEEKKCR